MKLIWRILKYRDSLEKQWCCGNSCLWERLVVVPCAKMPKIQQPQSRLIADCENSNLSSALKIMFQKNSTAPKMLKMVTSHQKSAVIPKIMRFMMFLHVLCSSFDSTRIRPVFFPRRWSQVRQQMLQFFLDLSQQLRQPIITIQHFITFRCFSGTWSDFHNQIWVYPTKNNLVPGTWSIRRTL